MHKLFLLLITCLLITISCKHNNTEEVFHFDSEKSFLYNNTGLSDSAKIGKQIFFDTSLSEPSGISCASCHSPMVAFSDPRHTDFSMGASHQQGHRNAPAISYMSYAPNRRNEIVRGVLETVGGFFWDGKAEFLNQQALFPLTNSSEMNNPNFGVIAEKIKKAPYYRDLQKLFGKAALADSQTIVLYTVLCLQSFQQSVQVNPFSSKFDYYLQGKVKLSEQELRGMKLFNDTTKAKCSICHLSTPTSYASTNKVLFTDFSYDNIGLPKHPALKNLPIDSGIGKFEIHNKMDIGRFKTPTLRNVAITAPYMHSGIFHTLEEVLEFYNERDNNPKFAPPEVPNTMNKEFMGNLGLTKQEIDDIIVFLKTLTDGYEIKK